MREKRITKRAGLLCLALSAVVLLPGRGAAAGPAQWLLKAGDLWVSDRTFIMSLAVKKGEAAKGDTAKRGREQLEKLRTRLVLAAAAQRDGFGKDPAVLRLLDEFKASHLVDLYLQEKVMKPAREVARSKQRTLKRSPREETATFIEERDRLYHEIDAAAAKEIPAEIDAPALAAIAKREGGGDVVVARVAGKEVRSGELLVGLARVWHPGKQESEVSVARKVLESALTRLRFAALAQREGFAARPEFIDDLQDRALRILADAYAEQKVYPGVVVEEGEIAKAYERQKEGLRRGEEKEIYEILVKTREEADAVLARLKAGSDFTEEVRAHSTAPTREKGGLVGYLQEKEALPALDDAIRNLAPGGISPVVESPFGYHILLCKGLQSGRIPPLSEVKSLLEQQLREQRRAEALAAAATALAREIQVSVNETRYQEILKTP